MPSIQFDQCTHVGMERKENQDHMGYFKGHKGQLFVVCDGMGGHAGGQIASRLAVETVEKIFVQAEEDESPPELLERCLKEANQAIYQYALDHAEYMSMGTTGVALLIDPNREEAHIAHVGDSRIYRVGNGWIQRLTRDHTAVQYLVDRGLLNEKDAANHPRAHVINRSLGVMQDVEVELGEEPIPLKEGECFILCSDGLTTMLEEVEIYQKLAQSPIQNAAHDLVDLANEKGGYDNVTVQVIQIGERERCEDYKDRPEELRIIHPPKPQLEEDKYIDPEEEEGWNLGTILLILIVLIMTGVTLYFAFS